MLKILVLIQCDVCDGVLNQIAVAEDPSRPVVADADDSLYEKIHDLQLGAEEHGWQSMRDATVHYCAECCRA